MIGASCTSGHPIDRHASHPTAIEPTSNTSHELAGLMNHVRAPASPAPSWSGGCSKGAAETPFDSRAPALPAQSDARGAKPPSERTSGSASKVRLDDPLVGLDEAGWPLGDLLAVVEHEHHLAEPHHDLHVVLDQEDRAALVPQPGD